MQGLRDIIKQTEKEYSDKKGHGPQFPNTRGELGRPAEPEVFTYFLGVGVRPGRFSDAEAVRQGLEFFNNKLVPLFPNSRNLESLTEIRDYGQPCKPMEATAPPRARPAVLRESVDKPRLLLVSAAEDCRAPSPAGTSP